MKFRFDPQLSRTAIHCWSTLYFLAVLGILYSLFLLFSPGVALLIGSISVLLIARNVLAADDEEEDE